MHSAGDQRDLNQRPAFHRAQRAVIQSSLSGSVGFRSGDVGTSGLAVFRQPVDQQSFSRLGRLCENRKVLFRHGPFRKLLGKSLADFRILSKHEHAAGGSIKPVRNAEVDVSFFAVLLRKPRFDFVDERPRPDERSFGEPANWLVDGQQRTVFQQQPVRIGRCREEFVRHVQISG